MRAADEDCCRYKRTKRLKKAIFRHDADSSARRLTNGEQRSSYRYDAASRWTAVAISHPMAAGNMLF